MLLTRATMAKTKNQTIQSNPNPLKNNTKSILCMIYHDQGTKTKVHWNQDNLTFTIWAPSEVKPNPEKPTDVQVGKNL